MMIRVNHVFGAEVELLRRVLLSASFRWHDARVSMLIRRGRRIKGEELLAAYLQAKGHG